MKLATRSFALHTFARLAIDPSKIDKGVACDFCAHFGYEFGSLEVTFANATCRAIEAVFQLKDVSLADGEARAVEAYLEELSQ